MNILVLRWVDNEENQQAKEYSTKDSRLAHKAMKWLVDNGAKEVDLAIRVDKAPPLNTEA